MKLKELFEEAYERCRTSPMDGVSFTLQQFNEALDKYDFNAEVGTKASSFPKLSTLSLVLDFHVGFFVFFEFHTFFSWRWKWGALEFNFFSTVGIIAESVYEEKFNKK